MKKIAVINQKGGAGKTTVAALLVKSLPGCLAVDLDPQSGLTMLLNGEPDGPGVFDAIMGDQVDPLHLAGFDLLQSDHRLDAIYGTVQPFIVGDILKRYGHPVAVMDCPPSVQGIARAAAMCADVIITPSDVSKMSMRATLYTIRELKSIRKKPRVYLIGRDPDEKSGYMPELMREYIDALGGAFRGFIPKSVSVVKAAANKPRHFDFIEAMING